MNECFLLADIFGVFKYIAYCSIWGTIIIRMFKNFCKHEKKVFNYMEIGFVVISAALIFYYFGALVTYFSDLFVRIKYQTGAKPYTMQKVFEEKEAIKSGAFVIYSSSELFKKLFFSLVYAYVIFFIASIFEKMIKNVENEAEFNSCIKKMLKKWIIAFFIGVISYWIIALIITAIVG